MELTIRISLENNDNYRAQLDLDHGRLSAQIMLPVSLNPTPTEEKDICWYLEDYLNFPYDQAPTTALEIESYIQRKGEDLFHALFDHLKESHDIWSAISDHLLKLKVTICDPVSHIPWEMLRTPDTNLSLACSVKSFVRSVPVENPSMLASPKIRSGALRVLMVIPRLQDKSNASQVSTGMRLVNGLCKICRSYLQIEVLHVPTYERLVEKCRQAKDNGSPYSVLHYDGLGTYQGNGKGGSKGYIVLEGVERAELIDSATLAKLLNENDIPLLSLNALVYTPIKSEVDVQPANKWSFDDIARGCICNGVPGVLVMPYILASDHSAKYVADLYAALAQGLSLSEANVSARKHGANRPNRDAYPVSIPFQDWIAPIVYESTPLVVSPRVEADSPVIFHVSVEKKGKEIIPENIDNRLIPKFNRNGVWGRDDTILTLSRAFDYQRIVLLHGEDGTGKTTAAAEFARWQMNSNALGDNPVLYTSFITCHNFNDVLEVFGQTYDQFLLSRHIDWQSLEDFRRKKLILDSLKKIPLLWIWDDLEWISQSNLPWEEQEKQKLIEFLEGLNDTIANLLILSNNPEEDLLKNLPLRFALTPLSNASLMRISWTILNQDNTINRDTIPWKDILETSRGNPLALKLLYQQMDYQNNFPHFVDRLKHLKPYKDQSPHTLIAQQIIDDLPNEEAQIISLLYIFTNVIDSNVFWSMGNSNFSWHIPGIEIASKEKAVTILELASKTGLAEPIANKYFSLNHASTRQLKSLFQKYYPGTQAVHAFVYATCAACEDYLNLHKQGNASIISLIAFEEANLLNAFYLAHKNGWRDALLPIIRCLELLFIDSRRQSSLGQILATVDHDFNEENINQGSQTRNAEWVTYNSIRIKNAIARGKYTEATGYHLLEVEAYRERSKEIPEPAQRQLRPDEETIITLFTNSLDRTGDLLLNQGSPKALTYYEEAYQCLLKFHRRQEAAGFANKAATCYINIPVIQDLEKARQWVSRSLDLRDALDLIGRGRCLVLYGRISFEKFMKAQKSSRPEEEQVTWMNEALGYLHDAVDLIPEDAYLDLGNAHELLGYIYIQANDMVDVALEHYNEAIRYKELDSDIQGASKTRFNLAIALFLLTKLDISQKYAQEALKGFETIGTTALSDIQKVRGFLARFEN